MKITSKVYFCSVLLTVFIVVSPLLASCGKRDDGWKTDNGFAAEIALPSHLTSGMVLQHNAKARIWGTALEAGAEVHVLPSWTDQDVMAVAGDDRRWVAEIPTGDTGGPYTISIYCNGCTTLEDIWLGELWLCSGQSNMEMPVNGFDGQPVPDSQALIEEADPAVPLRIFLMDNENGAWFRQYSKEPQDRVKGRWGKNKPDDVRYASATAYTFGLALQKELGVPVGLIVASMGSTKIETWMSEEAASAFPSIKIDDMKSATITDGNFFNYPCVEYNAKLAPFRVMPIAGMIWYQGESNSGNYQQYPALQKAFVEDLRAKWNCGDFPFYYVQIAPYDYGNATNTTAALMREAQEKSLESIPGSGMICTLDIGDKSNIHPTRKIEVGRRLANLALAKTYGREIDALSPRFASMEVSGNRIMVSVQDEPLAPPTDSYTGFEICGADKKFYPANALLSGGRIAVSSPSVSAPVAVRYCFYNYKVGNVKGQNGLPLMPFRTDK